jgi:hypothetical protein
MDILVKEPTKTAMEEDLKYGKNIHKYLKNNRKLKRWIKQSMNKRFRRRTKILTTELE